MQHGRDAVLQRRHLDPRPAQPGDPRILVRVPGAAAARRRRVAGSASIAGPSPRAMHAATDSAIPADAPGTTRAASVPTSVAMRSPLRASRSSIAAQVAFASCAAAHASGPSRDPPRSV